MKSKINIKGELRKSSEYRFLTCKFFKLDKPCIYNKIEKIDCKNCIFYQKRKLPILIIKRGSLGDVLRTTSFIKPLSEKYPGRDIIFLTENNSLEILKGLEVIGWDFNKSFLLTYIKFYVVINLDLDLEALLFTGNLKAKRKIGFWLNENFHCFASSKTAYYWWRMSADDRMKKSNKRSYMEIMKEIIGVKYYTQPIINLNEDEKLLGVKKVKEKLLFKNSKIIGINLGGGTRWKRKVLKKEQIFSLYKELVKKKINVVFLAGRDEKNIYEFFRKKARKAIFPGYNNSLREFFSIVNQIDILITSDSLAMHAALALNKRVIAYFGPTSYNEIELFGKGKKIITPKKCRVCYLENCDEKPDCMDELDLKKIIDLVN